MTHTHQRYVNNKELEMRRKCFFLLEVCVIISLLPSASLAELTCEALPALLGNFSLQALAASWHLSLINTTGQWSGSGLYCDISIDGIGTCWPRSSTGQMVSRPCPESLNGVKYNTTNNVYRKCLENGTWALKGNYSMCTPILDLNKYKMHYQIALIINYMGHCISMVALLVAFFLFLCLRSIRCLRNIIHWNLITAFILRNATWFVVQMTMNHMKVQESNVIWCRLVTASFNYFHSTNFFWMFGEGCYLHTAIVLTYSTDKLRKWMFICIGWCIPFPIIVAWAIGKLYYDNEKCWFGKKSGVYTDYIYQGPMILVLVINFIFLFNIVRILMTKLRASTTSETIQYRKAVKATLVLLPLLGITYVPFFVNSREDKISQIVFIYFNSFLESFQGFFVSVFYCFLNSEVRSAARKRFHRWQEQHSIRARMTQAMSIPTSPSRVSFHSIKQSTSL
ncbi:corticotropin-releasing factor receptor 1-like isoform X1 [Solea solea]|uniref:corticotropin-releasing factor receptor 1-like isoform X1 n=2 Tax=Solea solea TaxID=90069 RepID=UPI00272A2D9C|nr:corticotropin-releasing factor receptor 1-like isoform X1 [Solea solea]